MSSRRFAPPSLPAPLTRRAFGLGLLALAPVATAFARRREPSAPLDAAAALEALERRHGGRLGVAVLDAATGPRFGRREHERFAMCSTFKLLLSGCVLARVDRGEEQLDRALPVPSANLIANSPVTQTHAGAAMTVAELCHATVTTSDNTAANLLLDAIGGPGALTAFARSLGDTITRLDRVEPEMNLVDIAAGDERDTTSPAAMAGLVAALTVGEALSPTSRAQLVIWLRATVTGLTRLRAGLPADWQAGDKTGTGPQGPTNDLAVGWPPGRAPVIVAAYYERTGHTMEDNATVLAEVGRIVARWA